MTAHESITRTRMASVLKNPWLRPMRMGVTCVVCRWGRGQAANTLVQAALALFVEWKMWRTAPPRQRGRAMCC